MGVTDHSLLLRTMLRIGPFAAPAMLAGVLILAGACSPTLRPSPRTDPAQAAIARVSSADAETWLDANGASLAKSLSPSEAERVAAAALAHPSLQVRLFGIGLLFERVDEDKGAQVAAARVVQGDDLTGMFWGWMHRRPADVADRRLALIRKEVQARLPTLVGDERTRAEQLLCAQPSGC
ncbi:hypothetical protein [Lysobacter humi (ex Lee et al. 2017)]